MNKNTLFKNHDSAINISALRSAMTGKRVLVLDTEVPSIPAEVIRRFFDVVIAVGTKTLDYYPKPDIIVVDHEFPYKNDLLDHRTYSKYTDSILCICISELAFLKKTGKWQSAYILSWQPSYPGPSPEPSVISAIPYGLSSKFPGDHLARLAGASQIFSKYELKDDFQRALDVLINDKTGYIPTNILRPTRPQFLEEVKFMTGALSG